MNLGTATNTICTQALCQNVHLSRTILLFVFVCSWPCFSEPIDALSPDVLREHRILFDESGSAYMPIKIVDGAHDIHLDFLDAKHTWASAPSRSKYPKTLDIQVRRLNRPEHMAWIVLSRYDLDDVESLKIATKRWEQAGIQLDVERVGSVYSLGRGAEIDNRQYRLLAFIDDIEERAAFVKAHREEIDGTTYRRAPPSRTQFRMSSGRHQERRSFTHLKGMNGRFQVRGMKHTYRGDVVVMPDRHGLLAVINIISIDDLIAGILPAEIFPSAPLESQKALAVAARGALFSKIGTRHLLDPFVLCSEVHCQAYKGIQRETKRSRRAAKETSGQLLFHGHRLVDTVYSASCGGHTARADHIWPKSPYPELMGRVDDHKHHVSSYSGELADENRLRHFIDEQTHLGFCQHSGFPGAHKNHRWHKVISGNRLDKLFADSQIGMIRDIEVIKRGDGGRLKRLRVSGSAGEVTLESELSIRRTFGGLKSGFAYVDIEKDASGRIREVSFTGAGFGHGAGLCQHGAIGMSRAGHTYDEILKHYYPGSEIGQITYKSLD